MGHSRGINVVAFAPNVGRSYHLLATGSQDKSVRLWKISDAPDGTYVRRDVVRSMPLLRGYLFLLSSPHVSLTRGLVISRGSTCLSALSQH